MAFLEIKIKKNNLSNPNLREESYPFCPCQLPIAHSFINSEIGILTLTAICIQIFN